MRRLIEVMTASVLLLLLGTTPADGAYYTVTELGTLGGNSSFAYDVNQAGQVVGYSYIHNGQSHAFFYDGLTMHDLGALGSDTHSRAYGVNDLGQVVGHAWSNNFAAAFLFENDSMTELPDLGGHDSSADAWSINNLGQVAGSSYWREADGGHRHAVVFQESSVNDLGTLGGKSSDALHINAFGQVVGWSHFQDTDARHAFLWDDNQMSDLGTLGGKDSVARAINDLGDIVGQSDTGNARHAFLHDGVTMHDLGTFGAFTETSAQDINSFGQVVGWAREGGARNAEVAFLYQEGEMIDLNTLVNAPGWTLREARSINDAGQIVGYGHYESEYRAFLLTPNNNVIPAPSSLTCMAGLFAMAFVASWWRRRKSS